MLVSTFPDDLKAYPASQYYGHMLTVCAECQNQSFISQAYIFSDPRRLVLMRVRYRVGKDKSVHHLKSSRMFRKTVLMRVIFSEIYC
jgi:hypothetical protein